MYGGGGYYEADDEGSRRLAGKRMVVQASNIGADVFSGQFDLMVPGGGVGLFNACSLQWRRPGQHLNLGVQYGGFLSRCQRLVHGPAGGPTTPAVYDRVKQCVKDMCDAAFARREQRFDPMLRACHWFTEFYELADNPKLQYRPVVCPRVLAERAGTGEFSPYVARAP